MAVSYLTEAEYFAADDVAEYPLEYVDGEVFPIEAATSAHASVTAQFIVALGTRLSGKPCRVLSQPRVKIQAGRYLRPDLAVVCGEAASPASLRSNFAESMKVAIEVISPSTEGYDRGGKFGFYRALGGLEQYVLVSQDAPHVDVFTRGAEGAWVLLPYDGLDAVARLDSLGVTLPLAEIFSGIFE